MSKLSRKEKKREEIWVCDWCGFMNDSRESRCQGIITKIDGTRERCNGVRKSA